MTDTLTVSNPGGPVPPTICGYNTGQHMWVPASDSCNQINIDIDTGSTTTTRKWQIKVNRSDNDDNNNINNEVIMMMIVTIIMMMIMMKVTQYECGNLMMPTLDCLQYHTSSTGTD